MTIGLIIDSLTGQSGYQEAVWLGVTDAARAAGVRIITFSGGMLDFSPFNAFEKTRNIVYELFSPGSVDALILCGGSIGNSVKFDRFNAFCESFLSVPVISVGPAGTKIPRILVDNDLGMQDILLHLIRDHAFTKIACITGPKGNIDADRRRNMYVRILRENSLTVDENLIYEGDFNEKSGYAAVNNWIEKLAVRPEAIVASNDDMAFGAMASLQDHGLSVPYSVAVTGFDDLKSASTSTPPLTTVMQPIYDQGRKAVSLLTEKLKGSQYPFETILAPVLVCRQSCGCFSPAVSAYTDSGRADSASAFDMICAKFGNSLGGEMRSRIVSLVAAFSAVPCDERGFMATFNDLLLQDVRSNADLSRWNAVVNILRQAGTDKELFLHRAQSMISDAETQRLYRNRAIEIREQTELLSTERDLLTSFNMESLKETMRMSFEHIGIDGAAICLFDNPAEPLSTAHIVTAFRKGKELDFPRDSFPSKTILPKSVNFAATPETPVIVEALYYRDEYLGYIVYEQTTPKGAVYESLMVEISTAIKGTMLIEKIVSAERQIEERNRSIEQLIRPMLDSIRSTTEIANGQQTEIETIDFLNSRSMQALGGMESSMTSLASMLEKTGALVSDINSISEIINVVAINASIEAAHVGKLGSGFSVIAGEIRKLAESTRKNSGAIIGFLKEIESKISVLSEANHELSESFVQLRDTIRNTVKTLESISSRMGSLNRGSNDIMDIMNQKRQ